MNNFDPTNNVSWQFGHRGRVAVFIDGNNLFHAARFHNIDIDYNKLLRVLLGDGRLLRAFFYTGVDVGDERDLHDHLPTHYLQDEMQLGKSEPDAFQAAMRVVLEAEIEEEAAEFHAASEFIRITDEH